jgi:hypothetical protein
VQGRTSAWTAWETRGGTWRWVSIARGLWVGWMCSAGVVVVRAVQVS